MFALLHGYEESIALTTRQTTGATAEAPLAMVGGGLYVRIRVAGKPYWFYLDSDSYCSTIDPAISNRIKGIREISVENPDPDIGKAVAEVDVQIGGVKLDRQRFFESDALTKALPSPSPTEPLGGLIGYNVLRLLSIGIDFDQWRFWSWGPGKGILARKAFFGKAESSLVTALTTGEQVTSGCMWTVGGVTGAAELDTGSFWGSIPAEDAPKMGKHLSVGPNLRLATPNGLENGRLGLVDEMTIGSVTYDLPYVEVGPASSGRVVGWSLLRPLGRVFLDFAGSRIYRGPGESRISSLAFYLSDVGIRQLDEKTLIQGNTVIPISSVLSINGVQVTPGDWSWANLNTLAKFESKDLKDGYRPVLTYQKQGDIREISLKYLDKVIGPCAEPPVVTTRPEPLDIPGYYLEGDGHTARLPFGPLLVPNGKFQVLSIGGVPPPVLVGRQGKYTRYLLPRPVQYDGQQLLFGWKSVLGPMWISKTGESFHPDSNKGQATVPGNDAFSPGDWKWRIMPNGLRAVLSPPRRK